MRPGLAPLIRSWENGGTWTVNYEPPELDSIGPRKFDGNTPHEVANAIINFRKANKLPPDAERVWKICNITWGRRHPKRYLGPKEDLLVIPQSRRGTQIAGTGRRMVDPKDYGPWVWQYLNTFGLHFRQDLFLAAVEQAKLLLFPAADNLGSGCALCSEHFRDTMMRMPPENVKSREDARVWVWLAHDRANKAAGNRRMTFEEVARIYGWPQMDKKQFGEIEERLKS